LVCLRPAFDNLALGVIARSASDDAIQFFFVVLDCFAEPVIGRRIAPTRWLAMTTKIRSCRLEHRATRR
jgi:hypothetical protein